MNPYEITFPLTSNTKIVIPLQDPLSHVDWDYVEPILFIQNNNSITIANNPLYFDIQDLRNFLEKVLNNELKPHQSITSDIGYLRNESDRIAERSLGEQREKGFVVERYASGFESWVGDEYDMWYIHKNEKIYITWLYNDHNKNIIFKITPLYPYFNPNSKKQKYYVPYRQWIKTYEPYFMVQISRETAEQWLEQASYIVKTIDDNIARWEGEYEGRKTNNDESI